MLRYFIPITIISTPIGQITGSRVATELVEAIGGCLVTFVAIFEMYQKRDLFAKFFLKYCCGKASKPKEMQATEHLGSSDKSSEEETEPVYHGDFDSNYDLTRKVRPSSFWYPVRCPMLIHFA